MLMSKKVVEDDFSFDRNVAGQILAGLAGVLPETECLIAIGKGHTPGFGNRFTLIDVSAGKKILYRGRAHPMPGLLTPFPDPFRPDRLVCLQAEMLEQKLLDVLIDSTGDVCCTTARTGSIALWSPSGAGSRLVPA